MENLLQSLRGATLDDTMIAKLMAAAAGSISQQLQSSNSPDDDLIYGEDVHQVDDLIVASKAAEMELQSMRRYFATPERAPRRGIDGLADEELSSDSDDEIVAECKQAELSVLDKILAKNSLVGVADDAEEAEPEEGAGNMPDLSSVPTSVMVPYGAKRISLGKVQSQVDGLLVISEVNLMETESVKPDAGDSAACDVESLVFLSDSEPLSVIGMVVDTLGSVRFPMHLVLVTNMELVAQLSAKGELIGASVCTMDSHCRMVEVDEVDGTAVIKGAPQIGDIDDCDDDGAEDEDALPIMDGPVPVQAPARPVADNRRPSHQHSGRQPARSYPPRPQPTFHQQQQHHAPSHGYQQQPQGYYPPHQAAHGHYAPHPQQYQSQQQQYPPAYYQPQHPPRTNAYYPQQQQQPPHQHQPGQNWQQGPPPSNVSYGFNPAPRY